MFWLVSDFVVALIGLPVAVGCGYLLLLTLLSGRLPIPMYREARHRFDIIVPAHNEEQGIARTVENLKAVDYPAELRRILVVADNCTDSTADKAREAGATVLERFDDKLRGKGYALAFGFERSLVEGFADAVVVVDADTVVSKNLLRAFAARLDNGARAIQAHYGVANPDDSWRTRLMTIALGMFHRVRSTGREQLHVSCGLRGNGMCFSHSLIREVPHDAFSIVEDLEYGIRIGRAGHRVHYASEAEVLGDMVSSDEASVSQRRRWEGGRLAMARQHGLPLLRDALRKRSAMLLDLAMDVLIPPLSYLVLAASGLWFLGLVLSLASGRPTVAFFEGSFACFALAAYGIRGWKVSGVGLRGLADLAKVPGYIAWKIRVALKKDDPAKRGEWVRTSREGQPPKAP